VFSSLRDEVLGALYIFLGDQTEMQISILQWWRFLGSRFNQSIWPSAAL